MVNLTAVLKQLHKERTRLASQLMNIHNALAALNSGGTRKRRKWAKWKKAHKGQ